MKWDAKGYMFACGTDESKASKDLLSIFGLNADHSYAIISAYHIKD